MFRRLFSLISLSLIALLAFPAAAQADVNDFEITRWDQHISIDRDDEGRAKAHVVETVDVVFPEFDQNRGVTRLLLRNYEGARIGPSNLQVVDGAGAEVPFETESEDDAELVLVGDDTYLHGPHTFVISYDYRDIVHVPSDADIDEFSWDLLPLDRAQPIESFSARITFAPELADSLTGTSACYAGTAGEKGSCDLVGPEIAPDGSAEFEVDASLSAFAGISIGIALQPGTFTQPESRSENILTDVLPLGLAAGGFGVAAVGGFLTLQMRRKARVKNGIIVAQYDVPDSLPPLLVPVIVSGTKSSIPAEFIHLAVRGAIRIEDGKKAKQPAFRLVDPGLAPDPLDSRALTEIFGANAGPGTLLPLPKSDTKFSARMTALSSSALKEAKVRGLIEGRRTRFALPLGLSAIGIGITGVAIPAVALSAGRVNASAALAVGIFALIVTSIIALIQLFKWPTHTQSGAEAREYLLGVREFIRVAEADRIAMLQSFTGAERAELDGARVVQIYERLLPYAILFGQEKEWGKVLQLAYEQQHLAPLWYPGMTVGMGSLNQSLSTFTRSVGSAAAYSSSSSSSSGGGGFSGGGGGGGGFGGR